jgi:aminodeoxyfutalosine deaminase
VQDPELLEYLADQGVPLEVCPTSNIATRAVDRLENHPIREMYDAGVTVTVNSDDPPMFGTTLNREYEIAADLLDLDEHGIADLAKNAVRASFMSDSEKADLVGEIDGYVEHAIGAA